MKSKSSVSTIVTAVSTITLIAGLAVWLILGGGQAFSPGLITAHAAAGKPELKGYKNHAEFENQCQLCHLPLQSDQANLCMNCHQNIATEISSQSGLHAKILDVRNCFNCHPDHKGRDFSPALSGAEKFDHSKTKFNLLRHQIDFNATPLTCAKCHLGISRSIFAFDHTSCTNCHAEKDTSFMTSHTQNYGTQCLTCHDGNDSFADFIHSDANFALTGRHAALKCEGCHLDKNNQPQFSSLVAECASCHEEPAVHAGNFPGQTCDSCHSTDGWKPVKIDGAPFEHFAQTGFTLDKHTQSYDHSNMTCRSCHGTDIHNKTAPKCYECHNTMSPSHMADHDTKFNRNCSGCHDGVDRYKDFEHAKFFVIDGAHFGIECADCHGSDINTAVYKGLGKACVTCHKEPEIHQGFFGLACEDCHSTKAWQPAMLTLHDFPLDHGGVEQTCITCHPNSYTTYNCYACHDHVQSEIEATHDKQNISRDELPNCTSCHPTGLHEDWVKP